MSAQPARRALSATLINLGLDAALFVAALLALAPSVTGLPIHEWLSLALAATVVVHLLLHWAWLVTVVRRFFGRLAGAARLNAVLNLAFFVDFTVMMFTGLMISRAALPLFGITLGRDALWTTLHRLSADLGVFILGLHVALHWKWIVNTSRRYLLDPLLRLGQKPAALPQPEVKA